MKKLINILDIDKLSIHFEEFDDISFDFLSLIFSTNTIIVYVKNNKLIKKNNHNDYDLFLNFINFYSKNKNIKKELFFKKLILSINNSKYKNKFNSLLVEEQSYILERFFDIKFFFIFD